MAWLVLVLSVGLGVGSSVGQEQEAKKPAKADSQTLVYVTRYMPVADLASVLGRHLLEAGIEASIVPEPVSNTLLVSGSENGIESVARILRELDRAPKILNVEVLIVQFDHPEDNAPEGFAPGSTQTLQTILKLEEAGKLEVVNRINLGMLENQAASVQVGGRSTLLSRTAGRPDPRQPSRSSGSGRSTTVNTGTLVHATGRVTGDNEVTLELSVEKTQVRPATDTSELSLKVLQCESTISIKQGEPVIVSGMAAKNDGLTSHVYVIATANTVDSRVTNANSERKSRSVR